MKEFKFGIIGAGSIAGKFCNDAATMGNVKISAVSSKSIERANEFAEKYNIEKSFDSYEEMLKNSDIDAVYIATTHNYHYENIMLCLEHNKPVICEKCFVLTKKQAEEIFTLAKEKGVFVMEAMWSRFLPVLQKAKQWIDEGLLGEIDLATILIGFKSPLDPSHRIYNPKLAGGAMYDIGVYAIELITFLINEKLIEIKSTISKTALTGVDKVDNMTFQFENCIASLNCIITSNVQSELNIYGTNARIYIKTPHIAEECILIDDKGEVIEKFYSRNDKGFVYQIQEVINCVNAGKLESDIIPHKDTIQCAEIFDKCLV